jgi:aspartate aminotransferase-like enzyme
VDSENPKGLSLFTPGPVDLSGPAGAGLLEGGLHHRSRDFERTLEHLERDLKVVFVTANPIATITSSGTGAMEAVVGNLFAPGERVLVPVSGKFSGRWAEICDALGIGVRRMDLTPGGSPRPEDVVDLLREEDSLVGVLLTHCETSTGALTDVEAVSLAVRDFSLGRGRRVVTCVDCITSLCIDEFRMDDWCVDCAIGASQKGFLSPPGLSFVCVGREAADRIGGKRGPRYYFDLRKYLDPSRRPPFTPAVHLVGAVERSIASILGLGLPAVWRAYKASAAAVRFAAEGMGILPLAERQAGGIVAFRLGNLDAGEVAGALRSKHGIIVAEGQGELRGRILRVATMGKGRAEIRRLIEALASVVGEMGRRVDRDRLDARLDRMLEDCAIWESLR